MPTPCAFRLSAALVTSVVVLAGCARLLSEREAPMAPWGAAEPAATGVRPSVPVDSSDVQPPARGALGAETPAPATNGTAAGTTSETYGIHPGDVVAIAVFQEPDLSGDFKVDADGTVSHPLLGKLALAGLTVSQIEVDVRTNLAESYLVNPRVQVRLRSSAARRVIVLGEVKSPGVYELPLAGRFTLLEAVAKAGGFTELAAVDRVAIVRRDSGEERTIRVKVSDLFRERSPARDVELQSDDVVTVPQIRF